MLLLSLRLHRGLLVPRINAAPARRFSHMPMRILARALAVDTQAA